MIQVSSLYEFEVLIDNLIPYFVIKQLKNVNTLMNVFENVLIV